MMMLQDANNNNNEFWDEGFRGRQARGGADWLVAGAKGARINIDAWRLFSVSHFLVSIC